MCIAISLTTFAFVAVHLYGVADLRLLPYLALLSVWYGYLGARTQHFMSSAVLHVLHNSLAMLVAYVGLPNSILGFSEPRLLWVVLIAIANFWAVNWLAKQWIEAREVSADDQPAAPEVTSR